MLPFFWEKLTHSALKHQKCGGTFKAVNHTPPPKLLPFSTGAEPPTHLDIKTCKFCKCSELRCKAHPNAPSSTWHSESIGRKECLSINFALRETHSLNTTHMHLVSLAELITQPEKHSSANPSFTGVSSFLWVLTQSDELVTSSLRH